jgi:hypothetical protein
MGFNAWNGHGDRVWFELGGSDGGKRIVFAVVRALELFG